jgi:hypothetical protein
LSKAPRYLPTSAPLIGFTIHRGFTVSSAENLFMAFKLHLFLQRIKAMELK